MLHHFTISQGSMAFAAFCHYAYFILFDKMPIFRFACVTIIYMSSRKTVAQQSLVLITSTARFQSQTLAETYRAILPEILNFIRSPLLQGTALNCM